MGFEWDVDRPGSQCLSRKEGCGGTDFQAFFDRVC